MLEWFPIDKRSSFEQTGEIKMWRYHLQSLLIKMITCYIIIKCYTQNIILIGRLIKYAQKLYIYTFYFSARVYLDSASQTRKYFLVNQMNPLPGVNLRWPFQMAKFHKKREFICLTIFMNGLNNELDWLSWCTKVVKKIVLSVVNNTYIRKMSIFYMTSIVQRALPFLCTRTFNNKKLLRLTNSAKTTFYNGKTIHECISVLLYYFTLFVN